MGCGSSSGPMEGGQPAPVRGGGGGSATKEDYGNLEVTGTRMKFKNGKQVAVSKDDRDRDDDDLFSVEVAEGEQFMAVKPWVGQCTEPEDHPPENPEAPDVEYALHYVYGYRCADTRQNCYFNDKGQVIFMTAAVGVQLDPSSNTQKFFGGGPVGPSHKAHDGAARQHSDDIMCIALCPQRRLAATGQVGSRPAVFAWDTTTMETKARWQLPKGSRGVKCIAWNRSASRVACVDNHNDHWLRVYEIGQNAPVFEQKMGSSVIYDVAWSPMEDRFACVGKNTVYFFNSSGSSYAGEKGITGGNLEVFTCVSFDASGRAHVASVKGTIQTYEGRQGGDVSRVHKSAIYALHIDENGEVWTGGRSNIVSGSNGGSITFERDIRSIDSHGNTLLVGTRDGTITMVNKDGSNRREVMHSHSDGEVWGYASCNGGQHVLTSADDNKLMLWDTKERRRAGQGTVNEKAVHKKSGASTLSHYPANQQARAVAINQTNGHVAVSDNLGDVTIRAGVKDLDSVQATLKQPREWCEAIEFSPCGKYLAVGSHDNNIYIYDGDYNHIGTCKGHNSFITALDWSCDSKYVRSNCGAYELLFFDRDDSWGQDKHGRTNTKNVKWETHNVKIAWTSEGVFRKNMDGSDVNHCAISKSGALLATGDDWGGVNFYNFPVHQKNSQSKTYRAHSEHVVRVAFEDNDAMFFSVGGYDQTLMQWKRC